MLISWNILPHQYNMGRIGKKALPKQLPAHLPYKWLRWDYTSRDASHHGQNDLKCLKISCKSVFFLSFWTGKKFQKSQNFRRNFLPTCIPVWEKKIKNGKIHVQVNNDCKTSVLATIDSCQANPHLMEHICHIRTTRKRKIMHRQSRAHSVYRSLW